MSYINSSDYVKYLIKHYGVRGYDFEASDHKSLPGVNIILHYAKWLNLKPADEVLEVGCGVGRILKELHEMFQVNPHGIDAIDEIINEANKRVGSICKSLQTSKVEAMNFDDQTFNKIICWGVFDLTNQTLSLKEMTRVLKKDGLLLLTGKTNCYEKTDTEALEAEKACTAKNIPNHYTDITALQNWAKTLGLVVSDFRFFQRRGDFNKNQPCDPLASHFYEYIYLFKREHLNNIATLEGPVVGKKTSQTLLHLASYV